MSATSEPDSEGHEKPQAHSADSKNSPPQPAAPHRRRPRYKGKYPRRFEEKYKEHQPEAYPETIDKVIASGKTPAGSHRPIMVEEALEALGIMPGMIGVDCTLGYGGHAEAFLRKLRPGGRLIALEADPLQLPKTEERLRSAGFGPEEFAPVRANFAGLQGVLGKLGIASVDFIFADLGLSSMQIDNPARGFSYKVEGPLDMRMNPDKSISAAELIRTSPAADLALWFREYSDEPHTAVLSDGLAGRDYPTTTSLSRAIDNLLRHLTPEDRETSKKRVFQALRIQVNREFAVLETLLRAIPGCLKEGGRAVFLTFHSGEDRRVKQAFLSGLRSGIYSQIADEVVRPSPAETGANPRSKPAKLRWAIKAGVAAGGEK